MTNLIKEKGTIFIFHKVGAYVLAALIFGSVISYAYFANVAVRTLTVLEKSKQQMQSLSVEVSEMESKRLLVDNSVGNDLAQHLGFVEVKNQTFIVNKSQKTALSFKTD